MKERKVPVNRSTFENSVKSDFETSVIPICMKVGSPKKIFNCSLTPEKKKTDRRNKIIVSLKKKVKAEQQKSRRMKKKITSLKSVVKILSNKQKISSNCEEMLLKTFSEVPQALTRRMIMHKNHGKGFKYSEEIKSFALTLQFYSSKAYDYVRKTFNFNLPHQAQIRKWYGKVSAEPGFTKPAFAALKYKVIEAEKLGSKVICSLMLDEMAIKKHISWDGKAFKGYVDLGNGIQDDSSPVAKDALVLMAISINSSWKVPCGYFFIDGLNGAERANIVNLCIKRLTDVGVEVISLTCDGPSCHISMLSNLGVSIDVLKMNTSFTHPLNSDKKVHTLLDICHMLKLIRNCFADSDVLFDSENNAILWKYIVYLQKLQENEGLRLGNKLRLAHINWRQQKMKVNLAAQAISSGVANAIEFCCKDLKLMQFQGSDATVKFIRIFDRLFDILNSRNPFAKGYKSALKMSNKHIWDKFLNEAYDYISNLKDSL